VVNTQAIVTLYTADEPDEARFTPDAYDYTVVVDFSDGTSRTAEARIP